MDNSPVLVDILLIGGGHAHVYVLKMFGMQPMPGVRLTLITKHAMTPYSGMIPGHVAGHYTKKECHVDLVRLAKFAGARFILGEVTAIDRFAKTVSLKGPRPDISFDIATVDIGSTPQSLLEVSTLRRQREQERAAKYATKQSDKEDSDGFIVTKSVSGGGAKRAAGDETSGGGSPAGGSNATELPDVHSKAELQALSNVTPVKPIDGFSARWDAICEAVRTAPSGKQFRLVTVGGGAGGVELALSMSHRLREILKERGDESVSLHMTLLTRGAAILSSHNSKVQKCMMRILRERNVEVHLNSEAVGAMPYVGTPGDGPYPPVGLIECVDGSSYTFDDCVWCTQAKGAAWLADTGLDLDDMGFIKVTDTLESVNTPGIFACGDIACVVNQPRPKAGVYAVRQGKPLFDNLRRVASGLKPLPFKQQTSNLAILGCGGGYAVASKGSWLKLEGQWVWRLKDWIDRKWMTMYSDLPDIEEMMKDMALNSATQLRALGNLAASQGPDALEVLSHAAMRCGGCGSKVGATILSSVIGRLRESKLLTTPANVAADIVVGLDDPDDAAVIRPPKEGHVTVHTVDFFRSFLDDPYTFGQVAANHALSDCHAMCADAHSALAIVTVPYGVQKEVEETIFQVMAGACAVLQEAGCALVGGHTAEGAELSLGFAVNGVAREGLVLQKGGMRSGDKVIITKSVGTGALFAAHMRGLIDGPAVMNALREMKKSNQAAARILRDTGAATCCTDITGFGVVGHLLEMLKASDDNDKFNKHFLLEHRYFGAEIDLDALPIMDGAVDALSQGVTSSLQSSNLTARRGIIGATDDSAGQNAIRAHKAYPLLFDPQTAGGLLATVPADKIADTLRQLQQLGFEAACVLGTVMQVPSAVERIKVVVSEDASQNAAVAVTKRRTKGIKRRGGVTAVVSAFIWPENRGLHEPKRAGGAGAGRQLLLGLLLGLATAYLWRAVGDSFSSPARE